IAAHRQLTGARQILLLDDGEEQFRLKGNYIAETLYAQALEGKAPPPQAAMINDWAIYTARPVLDEGQVAGVLLVETTLSSLREQLLAASDGLDQASLIQQVDRNRSGTLVELGGPSSPAG